MDQIAAAHRAINVFMSNASDTPDQGMPRPASPAFTDNSTFASRVMNTLRNEDSVFSSPRQEDAAWASAGEEDAQKSYQQAAIEVLTDQLTASTSYAPLDKGEAKDPTEFPSSNSARLVVPVTAVERTEGEHDADDEGEQLVSWPP